ncbi:hypothetical protein TYRP_000267 [Tyrophagus putrescentiae]|nr:hypothetical protein TYRP_000267 [Tyrophagus putrescentiae]
MAAIDFLNGAMLSSTASTSRQKSASGARLPAATSGGRCGGGGGGGGGRRFRFWVSLNRVIVQHQQNQGGLCGGGAGGGVPSADTRHSWWSSMRATHMCLKCVADSTGEGI